MLINKFPIRGEHKRYKKDGSPRYVVRFRDPRGKKTERSAGSTKKAAENLKTRIKRELADGTFGEELPENPPLLSMTTEELSRTT